MLFKKIARVVGAIVMILISVYSALAQPSLAFDKGVDKTSMKALLKEIPESYLDGINAIYFNKSPYKYNRGNYATLAMFYKNSITIFNVNSYSKAYIKEILLHEIGHAQWLKLSKEEQLNYCNGEITDTCEEQFADDFALISLNKAIAA